MTTTVTVNSLLQCCERYREHARRLQEVVNQVRQIRQIYGADGDLGLPAEQISRLEFELAHFRRADCDPHYRIAVAGGSNTGKSEVINALLGRIVVPSNTDHTTFVPTVIRAGPAGARANSVKYLTEKEIQEFLKEYANKSGDAGFPRTTQQAADLLPETISSLVTSMHLDPREASDLIGLLSALRDPDLRHRVAGGDDAKERTANEAEVNQLVIRNSPLLEKYLVASISIDLPEFELGDDAELVDLPGNDAADFWAQRITEQFVQHADAMILVLTLETGVKDSFIRLLKKIASWPGSPAERLFIVINKVDELAKYRNTPQKLVDFFRSIDDGLARWLPGSRPHILCVSAAAALSNSAVHAAARDELASLGVSNVEEYDEWLAQARDGGGFKHLRQQLLEFLRTDARQVKLRTIQDRWTDLSNGVRGSIGAKVGEVERSVLGDADRMKQQVVSALLAINLDCDRVVANLRRQEVAAMSSKLTDAAFTELLAEGKRLMTTATPTADESCEEAGVVAARHWDRVYTAFRAHILSWLRDAVLGGLRQTESRLLAPLADRLRKLDLKLREMSLATCPARPGDQLLDSIDLRLTEVLPSHTPSAHWNSPAEREPFGAFQDQFRQEVQRWFHVRLVSVFESIRRVLAAYVEWHLERFSRGVRLMVDDLIRNDIVARRPEEFAFLIGNNGATTERQRVQAICKLGGLLRQIPSSSTDAG